MVKRNHGSPQCWTAKKLTLDDRKQAVLKANLCFRCLASTHLAKDCKAQCDKCNRGHHKTLCPSTGRDVKVENRAEKPLVAEKEDSGSENRSLSCFAKTTRQSVVLSTAKEKVASSSGAMHVSILFDSGSDRTYVTKDIAKKLKLREVGQVEHRYSVFGGNATTASMHPIREIDLIASSGQIHKINAIEVPVICNPIARPEIPQDILNLLQGVQFAECQEGRFKVDVLIGLDNFWTLMRSNILCFPEHNLVAQETVFGFVLSGEVPGSNKQCTSAHQLLVLNDFSEHEIRNLWELDYIGIMPQEPPSEIEVMSDFNKTIQFKEGRYWVSLPWKKDGKTLLTDNLAEAREKLTKLNGKLEKNPKLKFDCERVFKEWEDMGIIEEVPSKEINWKKNPLFYLPHRPVIRESRVSTKIRPVFDASAKAKTGVSLNDCLHAGPDLIEILIRFRKWKVALNADIQKAFLQICLQPEDKDVHRFFAVQ